MAMNNAATSFASLGTLNKKYHNQPALRVIDFVYENLPALLGNCSSSENEESINEKFCRYLDLTARRQNEPFNFSHETKQNGRRRIDFSAHDYADFLLAHIFESIQKPITVFEAKRLPAPTTNREKEYVTGGSAKKISGGIQRFKLGVHGAQHNFVAMIGYIQKENASFFYKNINQWLHDFSSASPDGLCWSGDEPLRELTIHPKTTRAISKHTRENSLSPICIHHLWVELK